MPAILFVCTANQCRSPVAERLFVKALESQGLLHNGHLWRVTSAGVWAATGRTSPARLIRVATQWGLDLHSHRSQAIEQITNLAEMDLILTMERGQAEALRVEFPALAQCIHLFTSLAGPRYDIHDPIGGSDDEYRLMLDELNRLINKALPRIIEMTEPVPVS